MPSFALIAEGLTDQIVLEQILYGVYQGQDVRVNPMQPARDATDESRQASFGGWESVAEYCGFKIVKEIFAFNDYLIIHIDTDSCEHPNFAIPATEGGADRSTDALVADVKRFLIGKLGAEVYAAFQDRIFFAIAVHSVECWILPLHATTAAAKKTKNCVSHLNIALVKKGFGYKKDYDCYKEISRSYVKRKKIEKYSSYNDSFHVFVNSLPPGV